MNNYFKKMDSGSVVISLILALLLTVTPLFSIGTRYVFGDGAERDSTLLKDLDVSIDGIDEGDTIGHADEIIVKVQFNVPLLGDDEDDFVNYEDFIVLKLSDYFAFSDDTSVELELKDENGAVIGHVLLSNDDDGKATATIKFDVESVFDDETNYEASGWFTATLKSNGEFDEDEEGKKTVTILDKTYEFLAPGVKSRMLV